MAINYYNLYHDGKISFGDIPLSAMDGKIIELALKHNESELGDVISNLYDVNLWRVWCIAESAISSDVRKMLYELMVDKNPIRNFKLVPTEFLNLKMCEKIFEFSPEKYFNRIPVNLRTKEMCDKVFELNPENFFESIPEQYKTREMCEKIFELNPEKYVESIPDQYKTKKMWNVLFSKDPRYYFEIIPDDLKTEEMYKKVFELNPIKYFSKIPECFRTKEMYTTVLRINFAYYSKFIPEDMIDIEIIGIAKIEMSKMIASGWLFRKEDLSKLMSIVINLYPECEKIVYFTLDEKIKNALYSLINNGGTIESIAKENGVSITVVNGILESLKEEDAVSYDAIKEQLELNQRAYFFNIMKDVDNLSEIIDYLGNIDFKGISLEQKLKFSYLCNKCLIHDLEEIYSFSYDKYSSKDYSNIKKFFNRVLKYNFINSDYITIPEKKTIKFNNSWFRNYNTERFFAIKNGQPTMERRYGKNSELLTLEIEDKIVNALKFEGIPLTEVLVTTAFKEYFNSNLIGYIEQVKGYNVEFKEFKSKKASSEDDKGTKK